MMDDEHPETLDMPNPTPPPPVLRHLFDLLYGGLAELGTQLYQETGRPCIERLTLTPEAGLRFGLEPGVDIEIHAPGGVVRVGCDRWPPVG